MSGVAFDLQRTQIYCFTDTPVSVAAHAFC